jgi:plasmid stabilization system protein ParE
MKVRLTRQARTDLREIREYHLRDYPATADQIRGAIADAIRLLSLRPDVGPPNRHVPGLRSKLVLRYPYRIHYRVSGDVLIVLHVHHTARRDWTESAS